MINKNTILWFGGMFIIFPLFVHYYNKFTIPKNDAQPYFQTYFNKIIPLTIQIPNQSAKAEYRVNTNYKSYKIGGSAIGYKSISGDILYVTFFDEVLRKYFKINMFDVDSQNYASFGMLMISRKITAYVNSDDYKNSKYGTRENPVPIFSFKGIDKKICQFYFDDNDKYIEIRLEPNATEYKHNVLTYLTYIMSEEEFEQRFKK
ncbi:hypothetical protein [Pedobacter sp. WC2423]|uniref:hypothetical protein n=1 Tax=Pedobacter sp. WC2423 TaxID=3234142 RepID=UPI003467BAD7